MPWWGWLIAGIGLLAVEMFGIDAQFYLVFLGVSAILVGLLGLSGLSLPEWAEWLAFAVLSLATMLAFRRRLYDLVRSRGGSVPDRVSAGDRVVVPVHLEPGQSTRVDYRGSSWAARNVDGLPIAAGAEAFISRVEELTLLLRSTDPSQPKS